MEVSIFQYCRGVFGPRVRRRSNRSAKPPNEPRLDPQTGECEVCEAYLRRDTIRTSVRLLPAPDGSLRALEGEAQRECTQHSQQN